MPACAILALRALVTGPNSTWLRLVQFMPVTRAINAKIAGMLLLVNHMAGCSSSRQDVSAAYTLCRSLLNVAIRSYFMCVNCRRGLFVAIILRRC